jgi:squalene-associated FAD-dependent desaturase
MQGKEGRSSFLKKRSKKLLLLEACGQSGARTNNQKFFGSFFQKRTASFTGQTHVIGAGLAGLAAALKLAEAGRKVTLYEAGPACGGRCRSYFDRELGCRIDNGNHLLLSGNDAAMAYLDMIGARHTVGGPGAPVFPFLDLATGERWTVRPSSGRLPWWLFSAERRIPHARLSEYLALGRLMLARADATVADMVPRGELTRRLLEPLAVSALNTPTAQGNARLFAAVIAGSLARGGARCIPLTPREGLSESFVDPALTKLAALGAEVRTGHRIAAIGTEGGRATCLAGPDGHITLGPDDAIVLATPGPVAASLLPGTAAPDAFEAILNLHFLADADPGEAGFVGLIGGLAEWVFVKPGVVSVTISAANRLLEQPADALVRTLWGEVCQATGLVGEMPRWRLIREKRATFAATFEQQQRRPRATTPLENLVLAGDWTDTGLPATIEGAIRSGFAAAQVLCAAL